MMTLAMLSDSITAPPTMAVAVATLILGTGQALQAWASHKSGRQGKREHAAALTRIENGVRSVEKAVVHLREETREEAAALNRRADTALQMLTGSPDGAGPNGHRGTLHDHEKRIRFLERAS